MITFIEESDSLQDLTPEPTIIIKYCYGDIDDFQAVIATYA